MFYGHFKEQKECAELHSKRKDVDFMREGFMHTFMMWKLAKDVVGRS